MIRRLVSALASLVALAAMLVGLPVALWVLGRQWLPDHIPGIEEISTVLGRPDDGSLFAGALVLIGFGVWVCLLVSFLIEVPSQLGWLRRTVRMPRGLGWSQQVAGGLLAVVLSVGISQVAAASTAPAAAQMQMTSSAASLTAGPAYTQPLAAPSPAHAPAPAAAAPAPASVTYTVVHGDTLWEIAETTLGDGIRYTEILDLNRGVVQADGGSLTDGGDINQGWVLMLPADATAVPPSGSAQVVVESGDTLSGIATEEGLPSWQPIFDLNAGEVQPGGGVFTDPDLIFPGQVLDLPGAGAAPAPPTPSQPIPPATTEPGPPPAAEPVPQGQPAPPDAKPEGNSEGEQVQDTATSADTRAGAAPDSPLNLAAVLGGAGGLLLAAGIGAVFWSYRRQRYSRRGPGRVLAPTPAALVPTETVLIGAARAGQDDFTALDLALRRLAVALDEEPAGQLPDVVAARMADGRLELRLHVPSQTDPPAPWVADESGWWWSVDLQAESPIDADRARGRLAPYPALVSIGDERGQRWLLDLERIGVLGVTGPAQRVEDLHRHLVAELAVNSWSDLNFVTMVGFGGELVGLHPERLSSVEDLEAAVTAAQARVGENREVCAEEKITVLAGRLRALAGDSWMPEVLVVAPHLGPGSADLAALRADVGGQADRSAVAVLLGGQAAGEGRGWQLRLTDDGRLLIPELDLTVAAVQLSAEQGSDIAALVAFERRATDVPIPAAAGEQPWQTVSDAAGALLPEVTLPRDPDPDSDARGHAPTAEERAPWAPAVPGSLLPHSTENYVASGPGTAEDVEVLAPRVSAGLRERIEDDLDQLDRDLADWWDPDCPRPRLSLLGRVSVRPPSRADGPPNVDHRNRHEEVIAYLVTRPHGATVEEMAEALRPNADDPTNARSWVYRACGGARTWLGTDPGTGEFHLSQGRRSPYALSGVLVDEVLFRQLRCRAGVRGREGLRDLQAALELVSGAPFDQRPAGGYEWLAGLDQTFTAMICDVAHLVVISALADDDTEAARAASLTAVRVAPLDESVLLDAMWVAFMDGNKGEAESFVTRIVEVNGGDFGDLTTSKAKVIERAREAYLARAS